MGKPRKKSAQRRREMTPDRFLYLLNGSGASVQEIRTERSGYMTVWVWNGDNYIFQSHNTDRNYWAYAARTITGEAA
jgi:hypothetical protein